MHMHIKVSVIIPVYNVEKYLKNCLDSVCRQSLSEMEIICINDASTDRSLNILSQYKNQDSRIVVIDVGINRGLSAVRNMGFELAHGEYVYFLDSDDMIVEDAMAELYQVAHQNSLDEVFFDTECRYETQNICDKFQNMYNGKRAHLYDGVYQGLDMFLHFANNQEHDTSVGRAFFRRQYLIENNLKFYCGIPHEDLLFYFQALLLAKRVQCLNKAYHIYFRRDNSITTAVASDKNLKGMFISYCECLHFLLEHNFLPIYDKAVRDYITLLLNQSIALYWRLCIQSDAVDHILGQFDNAAYKIMFEKVVMANNRPCVLPPSQIRSILNCSKVVVYGAGTIGRRVLSFLNAMNVDNIFFAVTQKPTDRKKVGGIFVQQIEELVPCRNECIVIIAVGVQFQTDVFNNLTRLGFQNILSWNK